MIRLVGIALTASLLACASTPPHERLLASELPAAEREAERRLVLDGAHNFRDLGGYETRDGKRVKWGLLYRSDALDDLSGDDLETLQRIGLRRVVDFRSELERESDPDRLPDPAPAVALRPIEGEALDPGEIRAALMSGDADADAMSALLVEANRSFVTDFADLYAATLEDASDPDQLPLLFHCTAGKDRAGYGAALLLLALGVPRETVMADYLLTNRYSAGHTERTLRIIRWASLFRTDPEAVRPLFEARAEYLDAALDTIDREYGDVDTYLRTGLGLDDATLARLRTNLLE